MQHQSMSINEINLAKHIADSNDIIILVTASHYKERGTGKYRCLLLYKQHKKYIEETLENIISPNHAMILGLIEAVKKIKIKNVNVCIISYNGIII